MKKHHSLRRLLDRALRHACFLLALAAPTLARAEPADRQPGDRPNILWLIADDLGWNDVGCYGNRVVRTPAIDRLAREGMRCTHAFVTASSCSPSRVSMFTGKYAHAAGAENLHDPLPPGEATLAQMLAARGYYTGIVEKVHLGPHAKKQFDYVGRRWQDFRTFLDRRPADAPFFLTVGFRDVHRPYEKGAIDEPHDPARVVVPPYLPDVAETREELALYYDEAARMDGSIATILAELERRGLAADTVVLFFSDNGMPFPRGKTSLYDSGIGTPLVVRWPGVVRSGSENDGLVSLVDLAPTMLDLAGGEKPVDLQGRSFLPLVTGAEASGRQYVFAERNWHDFDDHSRAVRSRRYKYIRNAFPQRPFDHPADTIRGSTFQAMRRLRDAGRLSPEQALIFRSPRPREELYDVQSDPLEFHNLAASPDHAGVLRRMRGVLDRWEKDTHDVPPEKSRPDGYDRDTGERLPAPEAEKNHR